MKKITIPLYEDKISEIRKYIVYVLILKNEHLDDVRDDLREVQFPVKMPEPQHLFINACNSCTLNHRRKMYKCQQCFGYELCEKCYNNEDSRKEHDLNHRFKLLEIKDRTKLFEKYNVCCAQFVEEDYQSCVKSLDETLKMCKRNDTDIKLKCILLKHFLLLDYPEKAANFQFQESFDNVEKIYKIRELRESNKDDQSFDNFKEFMFQCNFSLLLLIGKRAETDKLSLGAYLAGYEMAKKEDGEGSHYVEIILEEMRSKDKMFQDIIYCFKKQYIDEKKFLEILNLIRDDGNIEFISKMFKEIMMEKEKRKIRVVKKEKNLIK